MKKQFSNYLGILVIALFLILGIAHTAYASASVGTINTNSKFTKVCKDATCATFGIINFKPTINSNTPGALPVTITDAGITGHAWGSEIGWINFAPTGAGVSINPVTGVVSGKAYANVGGWINFAPTGSSVSLVDNGSGSDFSGWAWVSGAHGGWMKFDCGSPATCIQTDWRVRSQRPSSGAGPRRGGGGGGERIIPVDTLITTDFPINTVTPFDEEIQSQQNHITITQNKVPSFPGDSLSEAEQYAQARGMVYALIFGPHKNLYQQERPCMACLVFRKDSSRCREKVMKIAFLPVRYELPVNVGGNTDSSQKQYKTYIDGMSLVIASIVYHLPFKYGTIDLISRIMNA